VRSRLILALAGVCALALAIALAIAPSASTTQRASAAVHGLSLQKMSKIQKRILSGLASFEAGIGVSAKAPAARAGARMSSAAVNLCPGSIGPNVLVNQNCLNVTDADLQGRGQAQNETAIAENPNDPGQVVGSYNDYRRGDGNCGADFSTNGGSSWTDSTMPTGFTRGTNFGGVLRQYWQGGGDTSVGWDSRGNAYMSCQLFMRGPGVTNNRDFSSAFYVFRSTGDGGASWNFPGHPAVETFNVTGSALTDKAYMTVDNNPNSPFRDRIYVNQDSDPFVGPDGNLYVAFDNFNNSLSSATDNHNQVLLTRSTDGGQTFGSPVLVGNYYDLPDCATYQGGQDPFRSCVPEKGTAQNSVFRATNYPSGGVNPTNASQVVVTYGSYINRDSNESNGCTPAGLNPNTGLNLYTGVKTPGACNNKIVLSVSANGGSSFTGTTTDPRQLPVVNTDNGQNGTDQWWQWTTFSPKGSLVSSYYDRQYGSDETTGNMDFSQSTSTNLSSFKVMRVTSSSMPLPTQFPDVQGNSVFMGDYTGLSAVSGAHPIWMDTRNPDAFLCPGTGAPGVPPALCVCYPTACGVRASSHGHQPRAWGPRPARASSMARWNVG